MKDGRLFETVFYTRGGNQDFGLYADDGTDIGRRFYQGVGHHETGYKRSDGVDIGSLLFDNTEPVQGYITHNVPDSIVYGHYYHPENGKYDYTSASIGYVNFVAHPQRGSGIYSYSWSWWGALSGLVSTGDIKQAITTTASTFSLPCPSKYDKTYGTYGLEVVLDNYKPAGNTTLYFGCAITDGVTRSVASPSTSISISTSCTYCMYNCSDCD